MVAVVQADGNRMSVSGEDILYNGKPIKLIGLRCSNALISDSTADKLIDALDRYQEYGLNTISVFLMGSRFGDVKGYLPDGSLSAVHVRRLERILRATDEREMVAIVGCLYWSTSRAKEDLSYWNQEDADKAIGNTALWLNSKGFGHVVLDPDNEGMAVRAMKWQVDSFIVAAKAAYPELIVANNTRQESTLEDLNMHFGPRKPGKPWLDSESTPKNAPISGYWSQYSKERHQEDEAYTNYSRIGRYTEEMKQDQFEKTRDYIENLNGILLASTWIQCAPNEGVGGPFVEFGGLSDLGSSQNLGAAWNRDIDTLHPDAGILWWLEYVKKRYKGKTWTRR